MVCGRTFKIVVNVSKLCIDVRTLREAHSAQICEVRKSISGEEERE